MADSERRTRRGAGLLVAALLATTLLAAVLPGARAAHACIWDEDTLAMEQRAFPKTRELIAGHFVRHSEAYYRWRIAERERRFAAGKADAADHDDLAVAYEKTGDPHKAIEIMVAKEKRWPGLYETAANLGTFHIHAGDLETGLQHIERAIRINPEAHFGREIYQALLVQYVLGKRGDGKLPLPMTPRAERSSSRGFASYVLAQRLPEDLYGDPKAEGAEIRKAVKGVLGMMRFGNHASPVLLEALGDLLAVGQAERHSDGAARQLACRAYLKAARSQEGAARTAYRTLAKDVLISQTEDDRGHEGLKLDTVVKSLEQEIAEADAFLARIAADEARWIAEGVDVSAHFQAKYLAPPKDPLAGWERNDEGGGLLWPLVGLGVLVLAVVGFVALRGRRTQRPTRRRPRRMG